MRSSEAVVMPNTVSSLGACGVLHWNLFFLQKNSGYKHDDKKDDSDEKDKDDPEDGDEEAVGGE